MIYTEKSGRKFHPNYTPPASVKPSNDINHMAPCQFCGECTVWLAAFEPNTGLDTEAKVIEACVKRGCNLVGSVIGVNQQ